jgi:hypothetical protein
MMRTSLVVVALLSAGCSKGTVGGNPFGTATNGMVPMQDDDDESATDGESTAGSSGGAISESWSSGGTDPTTGEDNTTTSGGDGSTAAVSASDPSTSSSGGALGESSSSGEPPSGGQPATGMYAHCYDMFFDNCTAPSTICVNITGEMEGFCTADGCNNPALDCDAAPGGTAAPFCLAAGGYSLCALDCSGGASCATGMSCESVSFDGGVTNYNLCM